MNLKEARKKCLPGWNLRCNLCGEYPANWIPNERPGVGCLALCPKHEAELKAENERHRIAINKLRVINYEQLSEAEFKAELNRIDREGDVN